MKKETLTLEQQTDVMVKATGFDRNEGHTGDFDFENADDEDLIEMREVLLDFLEQGMKEEYINKLHLLLEVEYNLTTREGQ